MTITTPGITTQLTTPLARPRPATSAPAARRRRTVASGLRSAALAIWRLLPALSSSTPSDDAISTLSQSDRLGERR